MCGRFETISSLQILISILKKNNIDVNIIGDESSPGNINFSPREKIYSVSLSENKYYLSKINWGIKFSADSPLIFNSRIETIGIKDFWRNLFDKNRLIIPMFSFYEWKKEGSKKIPYRIFLPNNEIFFVPALYHIDREKNKFLSLITTTPNEFVKPIHHRMPVILGITEGIKYLSAETENNLNRCIPYTGKMLLEKIGL